MHAIMIEVPSERSREELFLADATELVPLHKQIRILIGGVAVIGAFVALLVILLSTDSTSATPLSSQQNALVQMSNVLVSENWTKNDGWGSSSINMCAWHGVVCRTDGVDALVTELNLAAHNMAGNIDDITMFGNLMYLKKLDFDSNSIVGNLTAFSLNLIQFSDLTYVDLRLNELTGSIPSEICDSMKDVDLRVDCDIECDCCNHDELCEERECVDVPGWHDSSGEIYNCAWCVPALDLQHFLLLNSFTCYNHANIDLCLLDT